jgi:hypothetical protein
VRYRELKSRWKYTLVEEFSLLTGIEFPKAVVTTYITLAGNGALSVQAGYSWDGPSGPMVDGPTTLTPSLVHDAFYQLLRLHLISYTKKPEIDQLFITMCKARGMNAFRAWYAHRALKRFGRPTEPEKGDEEVWLVAP